MFIRKRIYINAPSVILPTDNKALLVIINSKIVWYFLTSICVVRSGGYIEVKPQYFEQIPIPYLSEDTQKPFIEKADIMLSRNKELQETTKHFLHLLQSKFAGLSINNKLEKYYNLSFADFINELGKQKMKLSLQQESDWLTFFEQEKQKANAIKTVIDTTDKQIDEMVYKLYGLTEEEIKIVEG